MEGSSRALFVAPNENLTDGWKLTSHKRRALCAGNSRELKKQQS